MTDPYSFQKELEKDLEAAKRILSRTDSTDVRDHTSRLTGKDIIDAVAKRKKELKDD